MENNDKLYIWRIPCDLSGTEMICKIQKIDGDMLWYTVIKVIKQGSGRHEWTGGEMNGFTLKNGVNTEGKDYKFLTSEEAWLYMI